MKEKGGNKKLDGEVRGRRVCMCGEGWGGGGGGGGGVTGPDRNRPVALNKTRFIIICNTLTTRQLGRATSNVAYVSTALLLHT